ncbi:MAG: ATP-dependent helicase [Cyanobacteriota bacterium]|nr:ATP-dependent helicase [Cyanobacteriota bacterium]
MHPFSLTLRPAQQEALRYQGGALGISAVPGSGKTFTLELLISDLILRRGIPMDRVGVFTYMRSARANLINRVNQRLKEHGLTGRFTQAFTLHSLCLRILKTYAVRLDSEGIAVLEQYEQDRLTSRFARLWLKHHISQWQSLLPRDESAYHQRQQQTRFSNSFQQMCRAVIQTAKNYQLTPTQLTPATDSYLDWAKQVYQAYQAELKTLGKVDYDDLGWSALNLLRRDPDVRAEVQSWYDYLFEDESQDSSPLQEDLLHMMSGRTQNLVRVGDPNQSIMGTFTTAEPRFFREFCRRSQPIMLNESSRSALRILSLANGLVDWVNQDHPLSALRQALAPQHIQPASSGPANPPDAEAAIDFLRVSGSPEEEWMRVADLAAQAVQNRPQSTVVVLVPTNEAGAKLLLQLQGLGCSLVIDLLRNNPSQRRVIQKLKLAADYLAQPSSVVRLAAVVEGLADWAKLAGGETRESLKSWIQTCRPEDLLFPGQGTLAAPRLPDPLRSQQDPLNHLLRTLATWLAAARSPWPETLNLMVQTLYHTSDELFIGHYLADQLEQVLDKQPTTDWQDIADEIQAVLDGRMNNLPSDIHAFSAAAGSITVTTLHRSKGLEWDEVFIVGLSAYDYPVLPQERIMGLRFLEGADMQAEAIAELKQQVGSYISEGSPTEQAFLDLAAEKLRLLYVAITRAKRRLTFSVSSKNPFGSDQKPSALFEVLQALDGKFLQKRPQPDLSRK